MKHKTTKLSAIFLFCLGSIGIHAQEAIPASGGNASGSGGAVSYTVGQVFYTINTGSNGSTAQGVQQPFEISVVTGNIVSKGINLTCSAYPNPTSRYIKLIVEHFNTIDMTYQLYDNSGKLLENKTIDSKETWIDMGNLIVASYFLKISQNNKELRTFKIVKY